MNRRDKRAPFEDDSDEWLMQSLMRVLKERPLATATAKRYFHMEAVYDRGRQRGEWVPASRDRVDGAGLVGARDALDLSNSRAHAIEQVAQIDIVPIFSR